MTRPRATPRIARSQVAMLNWIWLVLALGSIVYAGFTGRMDELTAALFSSASSAITLVIGLVGIMAFLLGVMRVALDGGLRDAIARALAPLMRRLFPEVPPDHPAMSAMILNLASNLLGLGNAATPFGLKAMVELDRLNPYPGSASNAMILFLVINSSAVTLLPPLGTIGVRLAAGSAHPEAIWAPTFFATLCSSVAAIGTYYALKGLPSYRHRPMPGGAAPSPNQVPEVDLRLSSARETAAAPSPGRRWLVVAIVVALALGLSLEIVALAREHAPGEVVRLVIQGWLFPLMIAGLLLIGLAGGVRAYDSMIEGAKEGLEVAVRIVPYLVAILVAIAMFRASGALDLLVAALDPLTRRIGVPAEVLPMALLRPLSGSGAFGVMSEILTTHGPDSFVGLLASTLQGSTETTFYVLALYFGAARIRDGRHTLIACLAGDLAGFLGAVAACHWFFG